MNIQISIIIPTRNRATILKDTLDSLSSACAGTENLVEVLVIDNGSTDDTRSVVEAFATISPFAVRYEFEACPGLHVGRNMGAQLAKAEILAYLDDDVYVDLGWAEAVIARFQSDANIALLGGPCRPAWEAPVPSWVEAFKKEHSGGWYYSGFSLIDLGDVPRAVPSDCIFGCNFCVRKSILQEAGGFHPDGMPLALLRYRGDGEDAVAKYIESNGLGIYYEPRASIKHRIPSGRMTKEYILAVGQRSGVSIGYTQYRALRPRGAVPLAHQAILHGKFWLSSFVKYRKMAASSEACHNSIYPLCMLVAQRATAAHFLRILFSPTLARWVMQPDYFKATPCPYWQER